MSDDATLILCFHLKNMSMKYIPPHNPLLYSKTGVYGGIPIFLIFASKYELWVLVKTASTSRLYCVPTINVLDKIVRNIFFSIKLSIFTVEKHICILHGQVFKM